MQCLKKLSSVLQSKSLYCNNKINYLLYKKRALVPRNLSCRLKHSSETDLENFEDEEQVKNLYLEISNDYLGAVTTGHRVFVIQPYIKWGRDKRRNTTPELQLSEAVALINTLPGWRVAGKKCVPLLTLQKKQLLGSGALKTLRDDIGSCTNVTAVFVSTNLLRFVQIAELQKILNVPVYDRYSIVIHIFRQHAKSPEAKLQVALAEIPYIRKKMNELMTDHRGGRINLEERKKKFLEGREKKYKNALAKLAEHRKLIRGQRQTHGFATIAVVGYTNAGKTSLIRALTEDKSLEPENKLFATLDTTVHEGILPCRLRVLYVDTIGFIQDVPETLIEPFKVTLEDAIIADIIVHVYDASHPDMKAQIQHVQETIGAMVDENKVIINVANKCDLVKGEDVPKDALGVSAAKLTGIDLLRLKIEEDILTATGLMRKRIRVEAGSMEESWLYKEATITTVESDPRDPQYIFMDVIMTPASFYKFKRFLKE